MDEINIKLDKEFLNKFFRLANTNVSENIESKNSMYSVNPSNDSIKTAKSMSESCGYWSIPDRFLALYIDSYGEEEASNLISFLKDNQIYDLHTANWKMDSNGNIRIIDYSSWND